VTAGMPMMHMYLTLRRTLIKRRSFYNGIDKNKKTKPGTYLTESEGEDDRS